MDNEKGQLTKEIVLDLRRMTRAVYLDSKRMVKNFGLSNPQCLVLKTIDTHGPSSLAELSRHLNVSSANMTGLVDRLEKKGLVKRGRKEGDRRITIVELTETGKPLSRSVPDPIEEKLMHGLENVSVNELKKITKAIHEVVALLDAKDVPDVPFDPDPKNFVLGR